MSIEVGSLAVSAATQSVTASSEAFASMLVKNMRTNQWLHGESRIETAAGRREFPDAFPGIDISGMTWGVHRSGSNAASRQHRAQADSLVITKLPDASTAAFASLVNSGDPVNISIGMFKERGTAVPAAERTFAWLSVAVADAVIVKQEIVLPPGARLPVEVLEISYQRCSVSHKRQLEDGNPGPATITELRFNTGS